MSNAIIRNVRSGAQIATVPLMYGRLSAPPAIQNGIAFFGEGGTSGTSQLHAVHCVTGVDYWAPGVSVLGSLDCAPIVTGLRLFAFASTGYVYAFDISDMANPVELFEFNLMNLGAGSSAMVAGALLSDDGSQLYVVTDHGVYALGLTPAPALLWIAAQGTSFKSFVPAMNETLLFASTGTTLYAFDSAAIAPNKVLPIAWTAPAGNGDSNLFTPAAKDVSMATVSAFWDVNGNVRVGAHDYLTTNPEARVLTGAAPVVQSQLAQEPGVGKIIPEFEGGEHVLIGNSATLKFSATDPGTKADQRPLALPNGLKLTYGKIAALAADFYGLPDSPISDGANADDQQDRFLQAFATLATDANAPGEVRAVLDIMQIEIDAIAEALRNHQQPSTAYASLPPRDGAWNRVTGGAHPVLWPGRYMNLQCQNFDHFGQDAIAAYKAGHGAALSVANSARQQTSSAFRQSELELAYAMNAFADHFLSDLFAGGHIRTPRRQLRSQLSIWSKVSDALSMYMHNEDCQFGVTVVNARGDQWTAYGDRYYLDDVDNQNKTFVDEAVQASVTEIFNAFINGAIPQPANYAALQIIPNLVVAQNYNGNNPPNRAAMFVSDGTQILRRKQLADPSVHDWEPGWWSLLTLRELANLYGIPSVGDGPWPPLPPARAPEIDPNGWTSSVPMPPNWVDGNQVRYAVAFADRTGSGSIGPWSEWTTIAGKYCPTLIDIPVDHLQAERERRIYRQFSNLCVTECIGDIEDNVSTSFVDDKL